jgi:hypothetical protein
VCQNPCVHRPIGIWKARLVTLAGAAVLGFLLFGMNPLGSVYLIGVALAIAWIGAAADRFRRHRP